jgi:hypothetical protein
MKQWNKGEKVIRNNNTKPGTVVSQNGKNVLVKLEDGSSETFNADDLKRRR